MRTLLSLFVVLLFVAGCGGSDSAVREMAEEMQEPGDMPGPTPSDTAPAPQPQQPVPPTPTGTASCALPPLTVDSAGNPSFFLSNSGNVTCGLDSNGTRAGTVCTAPSLSYIGFTGNVVSGVWAVIDTGWVDLNDNGIPEAFEINVSPSISGDLNLANNGATMSITNLYALGDFYPIFFRGNCREGLGSTAFYRYEGEEEYVEDADIGEVLEGLEESLDSLFDLLTEE